MRKIGVIVLMMLLSGTVKAQFWNNWFRQKKTQRKYLAEQIIALKAYAGYVKKGYYAARSGLGVIKGFTNGEFSLHADYFKSLKVVNPAIKKYPAGKSILKSSTAAHRYVELMKNTLKNEEHLNDSDKGFIAEVTAMIDEELKIILEQTNTAVSDGANQMTDDERLQRLDLLDTQASEVLQYAAYIHDEIRSLALDRKAEFVENQKIIKLYGNE